MPRIQARFDKRVHATSAAKMMPRCHRAKLVRRECSFGVENLDLLGWDRRNHHRDPLASAQCAVASHDACDLGTRERERDGFAMATSLVLLHQKARSSFAVQSDDR